VNDVGNKEAAFDNLTERHEFALTRKDSKATASYFDTPLRLAESNLSKCEHRDANGRLYGRPFGSGSLSRTEAVKLCDILRHNGAVSEQRLPKDWVQN